ncbi:YihY/virulence factor BrkB family protein [Variovorax ureilyticus]|uniref:YihY/virulence factor BrkB family protein n=1 Tax=Variovorax ureilyticus TaxID=1836198 RepID=A0ABU8VL11_9BURK
MPLAPLLVIVIAVTGAVFGEQAVRGEIVGQLQGLMGRDGAIAVQGMIRSASEPSKGLLAGAISIGVLIVGATTVFAELQSALDRIWHVPEKAKPTGVWALLRARVLSFGLILGLAFLLIVSLLVSTAVAAFGQWAGSLLPGWELLLQGINVLFSVATSAVLFAMIFKFMPTVTIAWRDVWVGAGVTALLFEVGKSGIGLYLGKSGVGGSFAAAGSLVVLLAWVYYAAQIFLLGAEFTKVYSEAQGSDAGIRAVVATRSLKEAVNAGGAPRPSALPAETDGSVLARAVDAQREIDQRTQQAVFSHDQAGARIGNRNDRQFIAGPGQKTPACTTPCYAQTLMYLCGPGRCRPKGMVDRPGVLASTATEQRAASAWDCLIWASALEAFPAT